MDLLEIAAHNIGTKGKRYDRVAGVLITYACRESLLLDSEYKGFLTFQSKSTPIEHYKTKYGARQANGLRMYIEPDTAILLIKDYLES